METNSNDKTRQIRVHGVCEGFTVEMDIETPLSKLPAVLRQMRRYGIDPEPQRAHEWQWTPAAEGEEALPICPKHGVPMQRRSKQGDVWYSHKVVGSDGKEFYCRGYPTGKADDGFSID